MLFIEKYKTLFIAGTDTGIGKTYTCLKIAQELLKKGKKVAYLKPIQTGCTDKDPNGNWLAPYVEFIKANCPAFFTKYVYAYKLPATPALAAQEEHKIIDFDKIKTELCKLEKDFDHIVIESAGGLIVPVSQKKTMTDLIKFLNVPTLLVSANRLGTINQTCLSIYYAQSLKINLIGFTFSGLPATSETIEKVSSSNAAFIEAFSNLDFLQI